MRLNSLARIVGTTLFVAALLGTTDVLAQIADSGTYLDLQSVSPNNVFGPTQQAGGTFINGGFLAATGSSGSYSSLISAGSYAEWTNGASTLDYKLNWQGSGNQIGFSAPETATVNGSAVNLLNGSWTYHLLDSASSSVSVSAFSNGSSLSLPTSLQPAPFVQNVTYNIIQSLPAPGVPQYTPQFNWAQPGGYAPDAQRIEIWQINPGGQSTQVGGSYTLSGTATSFQVNRGLLTTGQQYAVDIEDLTLVNPSSGVVSNDNVLTRSRALFDFTATNSLGSASTVGIPMVTNEAGQVVYQFNQAITPDPKTGAYALTIDPTVATGYLYQAGTGNPNFTSFTLPTVGSGAYQLFLLESGKYVDVGGVNGGTTYSFSQWGFTNGVSSFEIRGIDPSAGLDPNNATAFATSLTFASGGTFTGTMTPLVTPLPAAAWMLLSGLGGLGAIARKRKAA